MELALIYLGVAALCVAPLLVIGGIRALAPRARRRRAARRAPLVKIAAAKRGEAVRIRGVIRASAQPLVLPFSPLPGVYHFTQLINTANFGQSDVASAFRWCPFVVDDESGSATVHLASPIDAVTSEAESGSVEREHADVVRVFGSHPSGWIGKMPLSWRQHRIVVGDEVTIFGRAELEPLASVERSAREGSYREAPQQLVLQPVDGAVVVVPK